MNLFAFAVCVLLRYPWHPPKQVVSAIPGLSNKKGRSTLSSVCCHPLTKQSGFQILVQIVRHLCSHAQEPKAMIFAFRFNKLSIENENLYLIFTPLPYRLCPN